jgi:hypothetical protein
MSSTGLVMTVYAASILTAYFIHAVCMKLAERKDRRLVRDFERADYSGSIEIFERRGNSGRDYR